MPLLARFLRFLFTGFACVAGAAFAQNNAGAPLSPDRVTFFTEPDFKGESLVVEAGASVENLERMVRANQAPWAQAISSIRVEGSARATVYSGTGLSGDRVEILGSVADLYGESRGRTNGGNWDRAIVSLSVVNPRATAAPPPPPPAYPTTGDRPTTVVVVPQPPPPPPQRVIVVEPPRPRLDPRTAEMIVQRAFRDVLDRPADPEGLRLYRQRLMMEGWTERQVIEQLQRSNEARSINPDVAIARAFREVLGRDPDANGLAHYRSKWKQGWTQGQIREDLRRSGEGRDAVIRGVITRAYRELLGRDPDPAGYATYEKAMRERGYTERDIRAALMNGDEYKQRQRGKR